VIAQEPLAGIVPPESWKPVSPEPIAPAAWSPSVPPQVLVVVALAIVIAPGAMGSVSVKAAPVIAIEFVLESVTVRLVVPDTGMLGAPKAFVVVGSASTVTPALVAVETAPPLVVVIVFAASVLVYAPAVV